MNLPQGLGSLPFFAFLAPLLLFWQQSRNFVVKIFNLFWKRRPLPFTTDVLNSIVYKKLLDNSYVIHLDDFKVKGYTFYFNKYKGYYSGFFKLYTMEIFLYKKFIPVFLYGSKNGDLVLAYLKFTFNFDKFFSSCLEKYYEETQKEYFERDRRRFYIEEFRGASLKELSGMKNSSENNEITLSPEVSKSESNQDRTPYTINPFSIKINNIQDRVYNVDIRDLEWDAPTTEKSKYVFTETGLHVLSVVEKWLNAKQWYEERNINYRRGIVLHGTPGTGKSALILEIAKKVQIPIFIFDLSTFSNHEFSNRIEKISGGDSAILLFEDIDNIWDGRKIVNKMHNIDQLTFDCFINHLSGVKSIKNKFIFITTNHLEKIDSALLRRGRIDEVIELPSLNMEEKRKMASIILNGNNKIIDQLINDGLQDTTAEFENRCIQYALDNFWNNKN